MPVNGFTRRAACVVSQLRAAGQPIHLKAAAEIEHLQLELAKLQDDYRAAAQWCTDACCEFKKDQRAKAPDLEKLAENMAAAAEIARA